jgi:superfamily I DNA/RNA helicase
MQLHGEQKRVIFLPSTGPIQIKGVAGSGKTTIALCRAKHLLETDMFRETHVMIFAFNKSLCRYITDILPSVTGGLQPNTDELRPGSKPGLRVGVKTFHSWAWSFLNKRGFWADHTIIEDDDDDAAITSVIASARNTHPTASVLVKSKEFFKEEIAWLKGRRIFTIEEYLTTVRAGRGTRDRVTSADKAYIWEVCKAYDEFLAARNLVSFDDFANLVFAILQQTPEFVPPYSHIVVDEAQDLSKAQMLVLTRLVNPETNSITVIADAAQRIYKSGFIWAEVNLNVTGGRTVVLKKNYRNTHQIALAAKSLLDHDNDRADFTESEASARPGSKPVVVRFSNPAAQLAFLLAKLHGIDHAKASTVVLHRARRKLFYIAQDLNAGGIPSKVIDGKSHDLAGNGVWVCTLSSIKGLEFDNVFIIDVNDNVIPRPEGFTDKDDEFHISTERRLLYTAMTRARHTLHIFSSNGAPSRYIAEIHPDHIRMASENEMRRKA